MKQIVIIEENLSVSATLFDTPSGNAIKDALPLEGTANVWGEEIYFEIPVSLELEPDAREEVAVGELGYWPTGSAFCIFFGPTPVSQGEAPRAYSPVNVFGRLIDDVEPLKKVKSGARIRIESRLDFQNQEN